MQNDLQQPATDVMSGEMENATKKVVAGISYNVQRKYGVIDLSKVPDHANYSKVEKYLRSINIEVTRRMFIQYLKEELLPSGHIVKNSNYSYYTREQIIYYILVDMFKPILPLNKVKDLFSQMLKPMIDTMGLDGTFSTLCEVIIYMVGKFEEAVAAAISEENMKIKKAYINRLDSLHTEKEMQEIEQYANLVTLCMAKGALDFYKYSPATLLE